MSNPFAAVETAINTAAHAALSNARAVWLSGYADGVFDDNYASPLGIAAGGPVFSAATADVVGISLGDSVRVGLVSYTLREKRPDATGRTLLVLEEA